MSRRHNGEGSIYPVKNGYRGYVWCARPDGTRYRKYVKGMTYEETQRAWLRLREKASSGPVASDVPTVTEFLHYWLTEIARPNLAPKTCEKYELFSRLHIIPHLGGKRLDKLQVRDIRQWLNQLVRICQCCAQGKDAAHPERKRRCCAIGSCCHQTLSAGTRKDARNVLRAALSCAVEDQIITTNPAPLSGCRTAASPHTSAGLGPWMRRAGSWSPPAMRATCCIRRTSWSWSWACVKVSCWA